MTQTAELPPRAPGIPREALLLITALFLVVAPTSVLTPLLPEIRDEFAVSILTAGWVVGSFGLARVLADLPAGVLIDRLGHRALTVTALILLGGASLVGLGADRLEVLIAARIGSGFAVALLATSILSALAGTAGPTNRGQVMSLYPTANNAGTAAYPLVGALIGHALGWRATFGLTAILAVAAAVILMPVILRLEVPRRGIPRPSGPADPRVLHGRRRTIAVAATDLGVVAGMIHRHGFRNTVLPLYAAASLGLGSVPIAVGLAVMSIAALLVTVPGGMLGDRIGRRRVIVTGLAALAIADLAFLATGNFFSFVIAALVIGACDFAVGSQTALLSEVVPGELRTRVLSIYRFSVDLGAFIGPVILAAVMELFGARAAIVAAALILLSAAAITGFGVPASVDQQPGSGAADEVTPEG